MLYFARMMFQSARALFKAALAQLKALTKEDGIEFVQNISKQYAEGKVVDYWNNMVDEQRRNRQPNLHDVITAKKTSQVADLVKPTVDATVRKLHAAAAAAAQEKALDVAVLQDKPALKFAPGFVSRLLQKLVTTLLHFSGGSRNPE